MIYVHTVNFIDEEGNTIALVTWQDVQIW